MPAAVSSAKPAAADAVYHANTPAPFLSRNATIAFCALAVALIVAVAVGLSAVPKVSVGERLRLGLRCVARGGGGTLPSALGKHDRIPRLRRSHRRYKKTRMRFEVTR